MIILYDLLIADIESAIVAIGERDIEKRTTEINHAFLILQQLEGSLDMDNGGEAAKNLSNFYSVVRCKLLEAQLKVSPETLKRQIELILQVRKAWQQVDAPGQVAPAAEPASAGGQRAMAAAASGDGVAISASWTA